MCTVITFGGKDFYFGRNMDIEGSFGEEVVVTPRHFLLSFKRKAAPEVHYAMVGMAAVIDGTPLYADAMNEHGLCAAALNFVGNAHYSSRADGTNDLAPYELIPYLLATCADLSEVRAALKDLTLVSIPFRADVPLAALHWIVADRRGSLVIESTRAGVVVYENPAGVLANNPPFPYHLDHLRMFRHLSSGNPPDADPYSYGLGGVGLPGDYSSPSRFVRAWFLRRGLLGMEQIRPGDVYQALAALAPVRGCVLDEQGRPHYTTYSCCMDPGAGLYTYLLSGSVEVASVALTEAACRGERLLRFPLGGRGE